MVLEQFLACRPHRLPIRSGQFLSIRHIAVVLHSFSAAVVADGLRCSHVHPAAQTVTAGVRVTTCCMSRRAVASGCVRRHCRHR